MRTRMVMAFAAVVFGMLASSAAFAQGQMQILPIGKINWVPCDPNAAKPDACQLAYFRGDPAKEPNYKMLKAKAGFIFPPHWHVSDEHLVMTKGTLKIAAEGGQEQDSTLKVGDYLYIPARRVHWGSCPDECVFYLYVDGPDSYIDAKTERP